MVSSGDPMVEWLPNLQQTLTGQALGPQSALRNTKWLKSNFISFASGGVFFWLPIDDLFVSKIDPKELEKYLSKNQGRSLPGCKRKTHWFTNSLLPKWHCCVNEECHPSLAEALAPCATAFWSQREGLLVHNAKTATTTTTTTMNNIINMNMNIKMMLDIQIPWTSTWMQHSRASETWEAPYWRLHFKWRPLTVFRQVVPSCKCSRCKSAIKWSSRMPAACHRPFTGPSLLACATHKGLVGQWVWAWTFLRKKTSRFLTPLTKKKKVPRGVVSPTSPVLFRIFLLYIGWVFDLQHFIRRSSFDEQDKFDASKKLKDLCKVF